MQTLEDILTADLRDSYGLNCGRLQPVAGGWMNKKWQTIAGSERLLIKQFSRERFQPSQLDQIGAALQRQMILEEKGIPCPHILPYRQRPLRILEDGTVYMVMRFCPGRMENRDTITAEQLRSLGSVCGRMHQEFAMLPEQGVKGFPIDGRRVLSALWDHFHTRRDNIPEDAPPAYREALLAQEPILRTLTPDFFRRLPKGIAHEDLSPDNLLFHPDKVSAVLDFDRNQYSFLWHDIGRCLLSFALREGRLDISRIRSFLEGYADHLPLTLGDAADALRITWCIEIPWWIQPAIFTGGTEKIRRFQEEMLWLTAHWPELEALLQSTRKEGTP